jgi:cell division protein FtsI (penicillin-binding protein 3)
MKLKNKFSPEYNEFLSDQNYSRLIVIGVVFFAVYLYIVVRLFVLVTGSGDVNELKLVSGERSQYERKEIVDRNGEILAVNLTTASLYAKPSNIFDQKEVAQKLTQIFPDLNYKKLLTDLSSDKKFVWIKRNITPKEQFAVNNLGIPGLVFESGQKRVYLHGNILSHILGYVDLDGNGIAGVEKYFDKDLSSDEGNKQLALSIDMRVQNIVHEELLSAKLKYDADAAMAVVADVNSGEIYSMVSLPDFDPHYPNKASSEELFNRASLGVFELGSIFKALSFAMALDAGAVSTDSVYYVKNPIKVSCFKITDYKKKKDWMSVPEILMYSSNIGTARMILELGVEGHKKYLDKFGFNKKLNVELPEKGLPILPSPKLWNEVNTITMSYGHGFAITPLHMVEAFAAVVNGGNKYPLTLIKDKNEGAVVEKIISSDVSKTLNKMLRLVVEKGYGRLADVKGYYVGGKTGSADKPNKGGYSTNAKLSSFISAFPMHNPKFVVMVTLDNPKKGAAQTTVGGRAASPIAAEIIAKIAPVLKISPEFENEEAIKEQLYINHSLEPEELDVS